MAAIKFNVVLFDGFETLDAMGPAEVVGKLPEHYDVTCISLNGGTVTSAQQVRFDTLSFEQADPTGIVLIPGGAGTRVLVNDAAFVDALRQMTRQARWVLTVCTGTALLAKTSLLDGRPATTNKMVFDWVVSQGPRVDWEKSARWVVDGNCYTSSGISAGIDMTLGFVADRLGDETARLIARRMEYLWNDDRQNDPFALL